jgi:hypothetical protein
MFPNNLTKSHPPLGKRRTLIRRSFTNDFLFPTFVGEVFASTVIIGKVGVVSPVYPGLFRKSKGIPSDEK